MTLGFARQLRGRMTDAEQRLWYHLRARRLAQFKIKRQAPVGSYVLDFVCFARKLVIEVDGGQHATSETDAARDEWLRSQGFRVLRFWNDDVLKHTDAVLSEILAALES
ncbi:MAG: endonuclease domain-containing protein [Xanthobacteraceae bacterium]